MRVLVLGASGMLGFALHRVLHDAGGDIVGSVRGASAPASSWCRDLCYLTNIDAQEFGSVESAIDRIRPGVVINAIGVNRLDAVGGDLRRMFAVNSMLPRRLGAIAATRGFRLVHFSSDGVFSGRSGHYDELVLPDADDAYGMSKYLGEACGPQSLVLRTSLVGRSLQGGTSLLDWLLRQRGPVTGFRHVVFSGLTVDEIASVIGRVLRHKTLPAGVFHLSSSPISKLELLERLSAAWDLRQLDILPAEEPVSDRSLDSMKFRRLIGYEPPDWGRMIGRMKDFYAGLEQRGAAV